MPVAPYLQVPIVRHSQKSPARHLAPAAGQTFIVASLGSSKFSLDSQQQRPKMFETYPLGNV